MVETPIIEPSKIEILHQYLAQPLMATLPEKPNPPAPKPPSLVKIYKPFFYASDYQTLASLWGAVINQPLQQDHPYAQIAYALELGLQAALLPFKDQGATFEDLNKSVSLNKTLKTEYEMDGLSWFICLEKTLKKLPERDENRELKSILKEQHARLNLPASLTSLKSEQLIFIQLIWDIAKILYQDIPENITLLLYGSSGRAWLENALSLPLSTIPNDFDFSLHGPENSWRFSSWVNLLKKIEGLTLNIIKSSTHQEYAQISFFYHGKEFDLNFHRTEPLLLGTFSARVMLPTQSDLPKFLLEKDAILHFERKKIVISEKQFEHFLTPKSLHFLLKELCLRLNEGWKLSHSTAEYLKSKTFQEALYMPQADRSICIFLSKYLKKNPAAYLNYFKEAPKFYNILYTWMNSFEINNEFQDQFRQKLLSIESDPTLSSIEKNMHIINSCLRTIFKGIYKTPENMNRLTQIMANLETHLGTLGIRKFFQETLAPQPAERLRPR